MVLKLASAMLPYDVTLIDKDGVLRADVRGERTAGSEASAGIALWRCLGEACRKRRTLRLLVVSYLEGRMPSFPAVAVVENADFLKLMDKNVKIAFVDTNPMSIDDMRFAETVAINRGFIFHVFDNVPEAQVWLDRFVTR